MLNKDKLKAKFALSAFLCWDHYEEIKQLCEDPQETGFITACIKADCERSAFLLADISLDALISPP